MIHVGIDWAEAHHGVCIVDEDGAVCEQFRIDNNLQGVARLHEKLASYVENPEEVVVGIETDRGLLVHALKAAGYRIFAVNPKRARARAA